MLWLTATAQVAGFSANTKRGCAPLHVTFTDQSAGANLTYAWNLGNSVTASNANPSTIYSSPGTYIVQLTVTGSTGSSTIADTIIVYDNPVATFIGTNLSGCVPLSTQFTSTVTANAPGGLRYTWDFGDGNSDTTANPVHRYISPVTADVYLTVYNSHGCRDTAIQTAYVRAWQLPQVSFTANQTYNCGAPVNVGFTSTVSGGLGPYTYAWDFGDNSSGTGAAPTHSYNGGSFPVEVTVTDSRGCRDTTRVPNYIFVLGIVPSFTKYNVCVDSPTIFTNTTGTQDTATWDFGDGGVDTTNMAIHTYKTPGTFTVLMRMKIGNCIKVVSQVITIYPKAEIEILKSPDVPCPAPVTVLYTAKTDIPVRFLQWSFVKDGTRYNSASVSKYYPATTEDTIILEAHTPNACVSKTQIKGMRVQNIHQLVTTFKPATMDEYDSIRGNCVGLATYFGRIYLTTDFPSWEVPRKRPYPATITSYHWDFGDGSTSTMQYPVHTYAAPGKYTVRTIVTTSNGCVDTAYNTIDIVPRINPAFRFSKDSICTREAVTFYNLTTNAPPGTKFTWVGRGFHTVHFTQIDTFTERIAADSATDVWLISEYNNCSDTVRSKKPLIVKPPSARANYLLECWPSLKVTFLNTSWGADTHLWDFGDSTFDTSRAPVHTYTQPGVYFPTYYALNNTSGCRDTIKVAGLKGIGLERPHLGFWSSTRVTCPNIRVPFMVEPPPFDPVSVKWIIEGDTTKNWAPFDDIHAHWFQQPGLHDVVMLYMYGPLSCIDTTLMSEYIAVPRPMVDFRADVLPGCAPLQVLFRDSSKNHVPWMPNAEYFWNFGDNDSLTTVNSSVYHTYKKPGVYNVKLRVSDTLECVDSLYRKAMFTVYGTTAAFDSASKGAGPDSVCLGAPVQFRSASTGVTRLQQFWDFGDGSTDTGVAPVHRYMTRGQFPLRLISVDSAGCRDTIYRPVPINVSKPVAAFSMSSSLSICPPLPVNFRGQSTGATDYYWDFGDGSPTTIVLENPVHTFTSAGLYQVMLVASDPARCTDTTYDTVRVLGYNGALSFDPPSGCLPLTVTFRPSVSGIPHLTWDFGDGFTDTSSTDATVSHIYTRTGGFLPKVVFSDGAGCISPASLALDSVYIDQVVADFNWTVPCADTPFTLTSLSTAVYGAPNQLQWSSPPAAAASGNPASMKFAQGTYPVTLIATNAAGCADTITKDVVINPLPPVSAGTDTAVCPGDTARLYASGALTYVWETSARTPGAWLGCSTCDSSLGWLNQQQDAVYVLSGRDANGCYGRDSVAVRIQIKTTSTTGPGGAICYGESFRLEAGGADTYLWTPAETVDSPTIAAPLATPRTTTTYTVISQEGSCQVDTQRITVGVNARPAFSAGPDKIISLGAAATLESRGTFKTIRWLNNDSTLSCLDCPRPNATPHYTRTYWATVTDENGCETTDSVTVHVRCNGSYVFIPNTFTPNGDGQNDWFYPQGSGLEGMRAMRIFNRWGQLVFESMNVPLNSASAGWDGRFKGEALAPDTYFYVMSSRCATGEIVEFKGDVTLVR